MRLQPSTTTLNPQTPTAPSAEPTCSGRPRIAGLVNRSRADPDIASEVSGALELTAVRQSELAHPRGDVIFVHGLDGDARSTWQAKGQSTFSWPSGLAEE